MPIVEPGHAQQKQWADQTAAYNALRKGILDYDRRQAYRGPEKFVDLPKDAARATQSALISCSTVVRLTLFVMAGVYADGALLLLAVCLLPAMAFGLWTGRRLTRKLSREAFVRLVTWLVLASGIALIARYLS